MKPEQPELNVAIEKNKRNSTLDWNAIVALISAVGLLVAGAGLFFTAAQIRLSRQLAKSEFMREFYNSVQQYNDIQVKLADGGEWRKTATSGPQSEEEWFRLQRYMGLLEQVDHWFRDGIMEIEHIDTAYSHRIKAITTHPIICERLLKREHYRWTQFNGLAAELEHMPVFKQIVYHFPAAATTPMDLTEEPH